MTTDADRLRARLRADLTTAMKARDKDTVATLRSVLAAFDNAEAVPVSAPAAGPRASSEFVAGTSVGLGAAEVARRELTRGDLDTVLRAQVDEGLAEADTYAAHGRTDDADRLRRQADLLRTYLAG